MADLSNRVELSYAGLIFGSDEPLLLQSSKNHALPPRTVSSEGSTGNFRQRREVVGTQATREHGANHFGVRGGLHQDARVVHRAKFVGVQFDR